MRRGAGSCDLRARQRAGRNDQDRPGTNGNRDHPRRRAAGCGRQRGSSGGGATPESGLTWVVNISGGTTRTAIVGQEPADPMRGQRGMPEVGGFSRRHIGSRHADGSSPWRVPRTDGESGGVCPLPTANSRSPAARERVPPPKLRERHSQPLGTPGLTPWEPLRWWRIRRGRGGGAGGEWGHPQVAIQHRQVQSAMHKARPPVATFLGSRGTGSRHAATAIGTPSTRRPESKKPEPERGLVATVTDSGRVAACSSL